MDFFFFFFARCFSIAMAALGIFLLNITVSCFESTFMVIAFVLLK